ncbi:MAG: hypothetical protein K0S65_2161 [Labilithrix sp.]|nr:hypothetical protein [Labilithrix sp.]
MILVHCSPGHIATAVKGALDSLGDRARFVDAGSGDLVAQVRGCRAIVYASESRMLDARRKVRVPKAGRIRAVIAAAAEPEVERVVLIEPAGRVRSEEARLLEQHGVAHVIVRSAPLVDELADATNFHAARSLWVARGGDIELACGTALAQAVRAALLFDELRGTAIGVRSERVDAAEAMRRAAAVAGARVKVRGVAPTIARAMRSLRSWTGLASLELEALCDRLGAGRARVATS